MEYGKLVISLDFELHWGSVEKWNLEFKRSYFNSARLSIPIVLALFEKYKIHATWATVGFLFAKNREQLLDFCPKLKPTYLDKNISTYNNLIDTDGFGWDENEDPYHYATSLISKIINTPNQEIATHTFSHYYCNEKGQEKKQFEADLKAAQAIAKENFTIELKSLVFPRNQFNSAYIEVAKQSGIKVVRTNPDVWFWKINFKLQPLVRAIDTLLPISNALSFDQINGVNDEVLLLPASRFLRPYSESEKYIQKLKFQRVKKEMKFAAKNKKVYHLWWHPHNLGNSTKENLIYLENILIYFEELKEEFGFQSMSMIEMY